jgi:hypothetical protein
MSWQSMPERARVEGMRAFQNAMNRLRRPFARPTGGDLYLVRAPDGTHSEDDAVWWSRTEPGAEIAPTRVDAKPEAIEIEPDDLVTASLDRIAETIDRLAAQLDAHNSERAERLDAIEFLLREVVLGATPSAARTVVFGGVMDPDAIEPPTDIMIISDRAPLEIDTPVEVRSRFHDRWIVGFAIAEAIEAPAGSCRYRLTRRSDGIPLPILFEACDVRAAAGAYERQAVE